MSRAGPVSSRICKPVLARSTNEVGDLLGVHGVVHVQHADTSVEVREEHQPVVKQRRHVLVRRMRAEAAAARAVVAAGLGHRVVRDAERLAFRRDVDEPDYLACFQAFLPDGLVGDDHAVTRVPHQVAREFRNLHERCGRPDAGYHGRRPGIKLPAKAATDGPVRGATACPRALTG